MKYAVTVTRVLPKSNPEWSKHTVEATSEKKAKEKVLRELKDTDGRGWGWTSYADLSLWDKPMVRVDDVSEVKE